MGASSRGESSRATVGEQHLQVIDHLRLLDQASVVERAIANLRVDRAAMGATDRSMPGNYRVDA